MTQRQMLHCSGSAYLFIHPFLRDYLADLVVTTAASPPREPIHSSH